jgi:hypothetical protein
VHQSNAQPAHPSNSQPVHASNVITHFLSRDRKGASAPPQPTKRIL